MIAPILWLVAVVLLFAGTNVYIGRRFIPPTRNRRVVRTLLWFAVSIPIPLAVAVTVVVHLSDVPISPSLVWCAYIGLGFLSFVFFLLLTRDFIIVLARLVRRALQQVPGRASDRHLPDLQRRWFLQNVSNIGILGGSAVLTGVGIVEARRLPAIVRIPINIARLPLEFEGLKIVQITDIHAGLTVRKDWIETIVREVNDLSPDLVAFTGDLADGSVSQLRDDVSPFGEITSTRGKYFVTGNHEYYSGVEAWIEEVDRLGYTVLLNSHCLIRGSEGAIALAGVTDFSAGSIMKSHASDPAAAIAGAANWFPRILLAHQPRSLYAALPHNFDLILSGHTHGGQFIPWNLLATFGQPYISGLHVQGDGKIYVSRGTGYWGPPVRLAARSEVTLFTLHSGDRASSV